jgi:hypothetical protein
MIPVEGQTLGEKREISEKPREGLKMEYKFTNIWGCLDAIKARQEQVLSCDCPPCLGWVLNPSGDTYVISVEKLKTSIQHTDQVKESLLRLALSSAAGRQNLAISLSAPEPTK